jgi:thymidylate synthase
MRFPVVNIPERNMGFKFMTAEAAWILSGDNRVETIAPFSKAITKFSDDGVFFHGAYGPPVIDQLSYICRLLSEDQDTRQAVMTIWRKNPGQTKDVPCTISVQWLIRDGKLHCVDNMRSSDLWLGWPYDVFNFSMLSYYIRSFLEYYNGLKVEVGNLHLFAGSQHIYERNFQAVEDILQDYTTEHTFTTPPEAVDVSRQLYPLRPQELVERLWEVSHEGSGALELIGG